MPVYKLDIQFVYETEYWTNKLYVQAGSDGDAAQAANEIVGVLKTGIQNSVTIDKVRITPAPFSRDTFIDIPFQTPGTGGTSAPAPLFNVVRWVFSPARGRGISHYFRGGVTPANIGPDQKFTTDAQTFNNNLVKALFDLPSVICNKSGQPYFSANAAVRVGMRQLRRGSKRKTKPVI